MQIQFSDRPSHEPQRILSRFNLLLRTIWRKLRYKIVHTTRLPKGDLTSFFLNLAAQGFQPCHILDVGANKGRWSRKAHRIFPSCKFTLVEPQTEMSAHLDRFCRDAPGSQWINAGVAEEVGELLFTVVPDTVSSSFTISSSDAKAAGYEQRIVPVTTLDHLVAHVIKTVPDVVKIDAEGFECRIMRGARTLIGITELFLLEVPLIEPPPGWNSFLQIVSMMADFGYVPHEFTSFIKMPGEPATRLCELAFARRNGVLRASRVVENTVKRAA